MKVASLEILLWGQTVGYLAQKDKTIAFEYEEKFKTSGLQISELEIPLETTVEYVSSESGPTFRGLPGVFADSLPDVYGNKVIENFFFKKEGIAARDVTPLMRLAYIHRRSIGALEYMPSTKDEEDFPESVFNIVELVDAAKKTLQGKGSEVAHEIMRLSSSAGGLRAKAVIDYNPRTTEIRAGFKNTARGFIPCIIKLDGAIDGEEAGYYGRVEYVYNLIARKCGIEVPKSYLLGSIIDDELNAFHFITERFDRNEVKEKLYHQITLCGLTLSDFRQKNSCSYESFLRVIKGISELGMKDVLEGFRRCIFNVVMRNEDDHTKNFSFIMNQDGKWKLAPAYDLTYVPVESGHQMSINNKNQGITREDLTLLGKFIGLKNKKIDKVINEVLEASSLFKEEAIKIGLPEDFVEGIARNFRDLG